MQQPTQPNTTKGLHWAFDTSKPHELVPHALHCSTFPNHSAPACMRPNPDESTTSRKVPGRALFTSLKVGGLDAQHGPINWSRQNHMAWVQVTSWVPSCTDLPEARARRKEASPLSWVRWHIKNMKGLLFILVAARNSKIAWRFALAGSRTHTVLNNLPP